MSIFPTLSSYSLSKLVAVQIQAYVAAEKPNVTAVAVRPGVLMTDMNVDTFKRFALDTTELVVGVGVGLATHKAAFPHWEVYQRQRSVNELFERKEEITSEGKLSIALVGKFGS